MKSNSFKFSSKMVQIMGCCLLPLLLILTFLSGFYYLTFNDDSIVNRNYESQAFSADKVYRVRLKTIEGLDDEIVLVKWGKTPVNFGGWRKVIFESSVGYLSSMKWVSNRILEVRTSDPKIGVGYTSKIDDLEIRYIRVPR